MDGTVEHNDSDSGESWTLLNHSPSDAEEAPEFFDNVPQEQRETANVEKDDDTDGISIISDSEPETSAQCEPLGERCLSDTPLDDEEIRNSPTQPLTKDNILCEEFPDDDFLENSSKHKTYVHRRNKQLSTVLNIIVLGSVITAAGVAIGHMWGARNDCLVNSFPSVNRILSNLYKLQEENTYLQSKLQELTIVNDALSQKLAAKVTTKKHHKCNKVFEEPLNSKLTDTPVKCVDNIENSEDNLHFKNDYNKKHFPSDLNDISDFYNQNRDWLDPEISKRLKQEKFFTEHMQNDIKSHKNLRELDQHQLQIKSDILETIRELPNNETKFPMTNRKEDLPSAEKTSTGRKITYADSLKTVNPKHSPPTHVEFSTENKKGEFKRYSGKITEPTLGHSVSEDEIKKDDRYVGPKLKQERKKHDRQKLHKKQKRRNKYEQWEMKGGYLKDFDDFSITSSLENGFANNNLEDKFTVKEPERNQNVDQVGSDNSKKLSDTEDKTSDNKYKNVGVPVRIKRKNKDKEFVWYEKRALLRNDARKKLEHEMFGETSPNNAGWYFRRMHRREQCRAKGDNSTYKKLLKRSMNFKTKH